MPRESCCSKLDCMCRYRHLDVAPTRNGSSECKRSEMPPAGPKIIGFPHNFRDMETILLQCSRHLNMIDALSSHTPISSAPKIAAFRMPACILLALALLFQVQGFPATSDIKEVVIQLNHLEPGQLKPRDLNTTFTFPGTGGVVVCRVCCV